MAEENIKNVKYTFLLPAYKAAFFAEALDSIKKQSYYNFKVIVSDDFSPENLKKIYDSIVGSDSRFVYRRNDVNMGGKSLVSHWNLLVDLCDTEFFIMASDDDVYEPAYLEEIDKLTQKYPDVNLFRGRVKKIDESGLLLIDDILYPELLDQAHFFSQIFSGNYISCEANFCYRTQPFKENAKYVDFPAAWFSDDATHILMSTNGCANTMNIVFGFRSSSINISNSMYNSVEAEKKVLASLYFYKWITDYKNQIENGLEKMLVSFALNNCRRKIVRNIENNIQMCGWRAFWRLYPKCKKISLSMPVIFYTWLRVYIRSKVR